MYDDASAVNPRAIAAAVLTRLELDRSQSQRAVDILDEALQRHPSADPRDRGLATELVYGTLRWRLRLDHSLRPRLSQRLNKLEPIARSLLRLGAYQLFFLDRIPQHAAVHATQEAARAVGAHRVTGLVNAVLRRLARDGEQLPSGAKDKAIAIRTGLPVWIIEEMRYLTRDPAELEAMAAGLRRRPAVTVRPTVWRGGADAVRAALGRDGFQVVAGLEGTLTVSGPGDPFATAAFRDGLFVAQDPASLAVVDMCGDVAGQRVLDLCAGRGVKSTALADRGALVTAVDISAHKLKQAQQLATQVGVAERLTAHPLDPTAARLQGEPRFDVVLVDAPCSGLGTIARRPEIAFRRDRADLARLAGLQQRLLDAGASYVNNGGLLVYAVCTFTRIETHPEIPSGLHTQEPNDIRRWRPDGGFDAFFARRMRRRQP